MTDGSWAEIRAHKDQATKKEEEEEEETERVQKAMKTETTNCIPSNSAEIYKLQGSSSFKLTQDGRNRWLGTV